MSPTRPAPWQNPFGIFYVSKRVPMLAELGAAPRVMVHQFRWESADGPRVFDEAVASGDGVEGVIASLVAQTAGRERPGDEAIGYHKYCLPEGGELARSLWFVRRAVERYDGDEDFGCLGQVGPDCYASGDRLFPADPPALRARPIHRWQAENEFFYQLVDCSGDGDPVPVSKEKAVEYLKTVAEVIRAADPDATIVFPAITGLKLVLLERGLVDAAELGSTDCDYQRYTRAQVDADPARFAAGRKAVAESRERLEYVVTHAGPAFDAIDFHSYDNDYRLMPAVVSWLRQLGLADRALVSTELGGPFFFFAAMGAPKPTSCAAKGGRDDRGPTRYSEAVLAEFVVKKMVIGLASGIRRMHWATGEELFDPYVDNYQRLGLVEKDGRRKPAYFTFQLLVEKLRGQVGVEQLGGDTYLFRFEGRTPVVVAWQEGGPRVLDLAQPFPAGRVQLTRPVSELDSAGRPLRPPLELASAKAVPVSDMPVFVEAAP